MVFEPLAMNLREVRLLSSFFIFSINRIFLDLHEFTSSGVLWHNNSDCCVISGIKKIREGRWSARESRAFLHAAAVFGTEVAEARKHLARRHQARQHSSQRKQASIKTLRFRFSLARP